MNNLRRLDLNLLVTLDVLLSEHNVTRAAERLNLAQPSVSVHLAKLRDIFGDPLLLPGPRGMRPTARADELREPLRRALEALERAVSPASPFDPAEARHTWRVAASDYSESTILLPALSGLRSAAPGTRLAVLETVPSRIARQAEQGRSILLSIPPRGSVQPASAGALYGAVCSGGSRGSSAPEKRPTLSQLCELEHVIVSPDGGGFYGVTDKALARAGLTRRVVLSVPHFLFVMSVLASTDLVAMLPSRLVRNTSALQVVEPPVDVPGFEMAMFWHERSHRDPAHQWLREYIADSV
ncbi:LysR family transcriptional regulator [Azotobacter chroococcum]